MRLVYAVTDFVLPRYDTCSPCRQLCQGLVVFHERHHGSYDCKKVLLHLAMLGYNERLVLMICVRGLLNLDRYMK